MSTTVERPQVAPTVLRLALVLGGLTAFGPLSIDMYLPAMPRMAGDLHAADATVQLTLTSFIIGLAIGQLLIGPLSDSLGRRRPLLFGLGLYVVGSVLCAISPTSGVLIAARAIQAVGAAAGLLLAAVSGLGVLAAVVFGLGLVGLLVPLFFLVSAIGIVMPNATSLALADQARSAGAASALLGVLQFVIGGGLATPLVGLGGPGTALPMAAVVAGFSVLALLLSVAMNRRTRTH
jgi:MFS family permease